MKKTLLGMGLVLLLFSGRALGAVAGSLHDLSTGGPATQAADAGSADDRVCIFCHTPHNSNPGVDLPLWNRSDVAVTGGYAVYVSPTFSQSPVAADYGTGNTGACLSCHDGTNALNALFNAPAAAITWSAGATKVDFGSDDSLADAAMGAIGNDFDNDHPVAFRYDLSFAADGAANLVASSVLGGFNGVGLSFPDRVPLYTRAPNDDYVECATCHNVHDDTYPSFVRVDVAASGLCVICHIK